MATTNVQGLNNIADLRAVTSPTNEQKMYVMGYYAPGDGGGGLFYYESASTEADNNGTIIKPTSVTGAGRWKRADVVSSIYVNARWFGVRGNGTTVDTTDVRAAFNYAASVNKVVDFGNSRVRLNGQVIIGQNSGFRFSVDSYGDVDTSGNPIGPGFYVVGSGYTAFVTSGGKIFIDGAIYGGDANPNSRTPVNGILFQNNILSHIVKLRVHKLNGFGVRIINMWDSLIESISIENCGNNTQNGYAFFISGEPINNLPETSNMTHILRLQVEKAKSQAIYIDPNSLCLVIDNIHSEQATGEAGKITWHLGGNRCTYLNTRLNATNPTVPPSVASVRLEAARTTYINLLTEDAIPVTWHSYNFTENILIEPEIGGPLIEATNGDQGQLNLVGGQSGSLVLSRNYRLMNHKYGGITNPVNSGYKFANVASVNFSQGVNGNYNGLAPNAQLSVEGRINGGILVVRDVAGGGTAAFIVDETGDGSIKLGGAAVIVLGDPGAGTNKLGVVANTSSTYIINRYGVARATAYAFLAAQGGFS
jgi:hypothetical protein